MRLLIALAAACLIAVPAFARTAEPSPDVPRPALGPVEIGMLMLKGDDARMRDEGEKRLKLVADDAAPGLRAMQTDDADLKQRMDRILAFAGGGQVVDGLRVRLEVDKTSVRPGDVVTITTTLMNLTDKPMQLEVGYTTTGNYFESGSAFAAAFAPGATGQAKPLQAKYTMGFCGTGATNIVKTIAPMSTLSYKTKATYGEVKSQFGRVAAPAPEGQPKPKLPSGLAFKYSYLPLDANGTLTLTVNRNNTDLRPKVQPRPEPRVIKDDGNELIIEEAEQLIVPGLLGPAPKIDPNQPFWHGPMKSNPVELKVFTKQVG